MTLAAAGTGKGSVETDGLNSFLVSCNETAAGAVASALKAAAGPPFMVQCDLKKQFAIDDIEIEVTADFDKAYEAVSSAITAGGFLGIGNATLNAGFANMQTNGGFRTEIKTANVPMDDNLMKWIGDHADDMRKRVYDLVKNEIFDWDPTKTDPAAAVNSKGLVASLFGGATVSLKAEYQHHGTSVSDRLILTGTMAVDDVASGNLSELVPAVAANLQKYLAIVDIGQFFEKVQVTATSAITFEGKLPDGTDIHDPIVSAQLAPAYPDYNRPLQDDGTPNFVVADEGYKFVLGTQSRPDPKPVPFVWTKDNARDAIEANWLRLADEVTGWPASRVRLTQTLVYDGEDPRVDLAAGGVTVVSQRDSDFDHAPIITAASVGYVYVHFILDRIIPKDKITLTLQLTIGDRADTLTILKGNQKNVLWELFSDKFSDVTSSPTPSRSRSRAPTSPIRR